MEEARETESFLDKLKPPRLEDAGLEDCALPPESIEEAFLKAAYAVKSLVSASDDGDSGGRFVDDPWEDSSNAVVGITEGVAAPSEGCGAKKGGRLTDAPGDLVSVGGGDVESESDGLVGPGVPDTEQACVDGLQGLENGGEDKGILGKKVGGDLAVGKEEGKKDKPTLAGDYV